ncbi:MAG: transcriptional repressor [Alphaproteobacteria bacterium]|nr:transcriptional repressor [Alphaproteobacteria bacterium]
MSQIEHLALEKSLTMTKPRKIIAHVLSESEDHPDVGTLFHRVSQIDKRISMATIYRTLKLFEEYNILEKHDFRDGRSRYEKRSAQHHDHLIDLSTGGVMEFYDEDLEKLKEKIARKMGYELVDHRLELYALPVNYNKK